MAYSKFRNQKTTIDGIEFASKAEAGRYEVLRLLEMGGAISDLQMQVKFPLQESFRATVNGKRKTIRAIEYIADFTYKTPDSEALVVEDVKGARTEVFNIKEKLFRKRYPEHDFRVVEAK